MSPFRALIPILALTPALAASQSFEEYLQLRKKYGIQQAAGVAATMTFVGTKVMEVKGTVKGTVGMDHSTMVILENAEGPEVYVRTTQIPDWLKGNETQARLLVKAVRAHENAIFEAELLGATPESSIASHEAKLAAAVKPKRAAGSTSRAGQRPPPLPGTFPKSSPALSPWIRDILPHYTAFIKNRNKRLSDAQAQQIAETVLAYSVHYGVDARLIMAIVLVESGFNPNATSHAGAQGLGQLMPGTARGLGVSDSYDTTQNLYGTVRLVRGHMDRYQKQTGDPFQALVLALAAYNAGSGAVRKHGGVPPYRETQNYISKVIATYSALAGKR